MKVYSHYTKVSSTEGFRWGTIIQFGSSWSVIGSVVMKNPGSSACGNKVSDASILRNLNDFQSPDEDWYEFSADDTMRKVAKLFQYKKGARNIDSLNGVILIFNLFYYREADLGKAIQMNAEYEMPEDIISNDICLLQAPVYLGFSDLAFDKDFTERARAFYDRAIELGMKCYDPDFSANTFRHPQYLMGVGKNQKASIEILAKFKTNNFAPNEDEMNSAASFMHKEALSMQEWDAVFCHLCEWLGANLSFPKIETNPKTAKITQSMWVRFHISQSCSFQIVRQKGNNAQYVRFAFSQHLDNVMQEYLESQGYCKEIDAKYLHFKRKRQEFPNSIIWTALEIYSVVSKIMHYISKPELL